MINSPLMDQCRIGCAACCIVISISSALPGMPEGKPSGVRCANLNDKNECTIHDRDDYPAVCKNFRFDPEFCGRTNEEAFEKYKTLELLSK